MTVLPCINRHLLILKAILIGYYGALGSLWPFLTLHMMQLGLSLEETAVINMILPFAAASCKPLIGIVADKTGRYKLLLGILIFLTCAAYTSLLAVPPVEAPPTIQLNYECSPKGSLFYADKCLEEHNVLVAEDEVWHSVKFINCSNLCSSVITSNLTTASTVCFQQQNNSDCVFQNIQELFFNISISQFQPNGDSCLLQASGYQYNDKKYSSMTCDSDTECGRLSCNTIFIQNKHSRYSKSSTTFWIYLFVRCFAEMLMSACYPLTDIINLSMCSKFKGQFGRQQLFGIFSSGVFALISGSLVDYSKTLTGKAMYAVCFYLFDFVMICTLIVMSFAQVEIKNEQKKSSMLRSIGKLFRNPAVIVLFAAALLMGIIWGFMETFLYWYLLQMGATRMLIGLTQLVSVLPALPLLYKSNWLMCKAGHVNILIFAFFVYCGRSIGYVYTENPWWSLLLESTKVFSMYLARLCFTVYADFLAPPELKVTTQAIVFLLHFDVGRGVGSLVGGFLMEIFGSRTTFQIVAIYSGVLGTIYLMLHHLYFKSRLASPNTKKCKKVLESPASEIKAEINGSIAKVEEPLLPSSTTINGHESKPPTNGHLFMGSYKDLKHTIV